MATKQVLTLHQGERERVFVEHPTEIARRALLDAAAVEGEELAAALRRVAAFLPRRRPMSGCDRVGPGAEARALREVGEVMRRCASELPPENPLGVQLAAESTRLLLASPSSRGGVA